MKQSIRCPEMIYDQDISGFHQYIIKEGKIGLSYVSQNLCRMLGLMPEECCLGEGDGYEAFVYPEDRSCYREFLKSLAGEKSCATAEYRLIRKDGSILFVADTGVSRPMEDGSILISSTLSDVTKSRRELQIFKETVPCGVIRYTCEKQPRITYLNENMKTLLRLSDGEEQEFSLVGDSLFLMIPMEERKRLSRYLERVMEADVPVAGEITVLRGDGSRACLFGWVTKAVDSQGREEFQSVCMDITKRRKLQKEQEQKRYMEALGEVYDKIFAYDLGTRTVTCLMSHQSPRFQWLEQVPMQMEEATENWIRDNVSASEQEQVWDFFSRIFASGTAVFGEKPPQITYHAQNSDGKLRRYTGIFLSLEEQVGLFCCRKVPGQEMEAEEAIDRTGDVEQLLLRFTDGIAAFELRDQCVIPLYASDNVCQFFGFEKEEWMSMMKRPTPIGEFVARSDASYEEFEELLRNGEAEFTYVDLKTGIERGIRAICSRKEQEGEGPRYVMLYSMDDEKKQSRMAEDPLPPVSIRTFGYFDIFVGDRPIAFRNKKSKELFALLVDRRGGFVTSEEAIGFLWEDEPVNPVTLARYRKVALRLKNILEEYGISHVVESVDGKRRIVPEAVQCDLYDYLSGKEDCAQLFKGSYLTNYSWGEVTLGELMSQQPV